MAPASARFVIAARSRRTLCRRALQGGTLMSHGSLPGGPIKLLALSVVARSLRALLVAPGGLANRALAGLAGTGAGAVSLPAITTPADPRQGAAAQTQEDAMALRQARCLAGTEGLSKTAKKPYSPPRRLSLRAPCGGPVGARTSSGSPPSTLRRACTPRRAPPQTRRHPFPPRPPSPGGGLYPPPSPQTPSRIPLCLPLLATSGAKRRIPADWERR